MRQIDPVLSVMRDWTEVFMRRSMHNFILFSKENNVTMSQMGALYRIHHKGVTGVSDLGDELGISSAASSQMLEKLVQLNLVQRTEDPNDRRGKHIALTEKGLKMMHDGVNARQSWLSDLTGSLTPAEREQVEAALQILIHRAQQLEDSAESVNISAG